MTVRDLTSDDIDGFLQVHEQRAKETRFAELGDEWTPASALEDVAMLIGAFCICMAVPVGYVLFKVFA